MRHSLLVFCSFLAMFWNSSSACTVYSDCAEKIKEQPPPVVGLLDTLILVSNNPSANIPTRCRYIQQGYRAPRRSSAKSL